MTTPSPNSGFSSLSLSDKQSVIELPERLTVLEAVTFKDMGEDLCQKDQPPQKIVLNFSKTKFMDSSGLGALIGIYKTATKQEIELILESVQPPVMAVFSMAGLLDILKINAAPEWSEESQPETHPSVNSKIKRIIDILGALVGLLITAVIFLPIVIAIKVDSPGPIFFQQTRCGWLGKKFKIWKFRSMCSDAEALKKQVANQASGAFFKNDNDPRVTKVGRFLRRTSLDEFPQFWNVLKGDMSLVGTRPPTPEEVDSYKIPQWQRLDVKPGITGEWQVNGRSQIRNFEDVIRLDLRYQENWSLKHDLALIIKTVTIIFNKDSGAV
ncbi:MAG: anti-sigma factor antagonist [Cyanobacteria bacterium J06638_38]